MTSTVFLFYVEFSFILSCTWVKCKIVVYRYKDSTTDSYSDGLCYSAPSQKSGGDYRARAGRRATEGTNHHRLGHRRAGWSRHPLRYRELWLCAQAPLEGYPYTQRKGKTCLSFTCSSELFINLSRKLKVHILFVRMSKHPLLFSPLFIYHKL